MPPSQSLASSCLVVTNNIKSLQKELSRRIKEVIGMVVSDTQCTFIKGRQIFNGILNMNELIHSMKKKERKWGNLIFKLDFSKTYDCVQWDFLEEVLLEMGFGERCTWWMMECVTTARATVLVNGSVTNKFRVGKGLRQGDPVSPFLFILVMKVLHLMLDRAEELGLIGGI
ncbi:secreted RxLR effector protein 78-like [Gossypium raimondii]|uniref:secreted RxLR effector protein 78-like n=1 Tax=Gossypium raimondii TaxID=29730 RepID=UPI00227BA2EC|nr:secreted RxLR effector protein 78-like [Gossypium raimondii]